MNISDFKYVPAELQKAKIWIGLADEMAISMLTGDKISAKSKSKLVTFEEAVSKFDSIKKFLSSKTKLTLGIKIPDDMFAIKVRLQKDKDDDPATDVLTTLHSYTTIFNDFNAYILCRGFKPIDRVYSCFQVIGGGEFIPISQMCMYNPKTSEPWEIATCLDNVLELHQRYRVTEEEQEEKHYSLDDTGNAYWFRDKYMGELIYSHDEGAWLYWDKKRWCQDKTQEVKRMANRLLLDMNEEVKLLWDNYDKYNEKEDKKMAIELTEHLRRSRGSHAKEAFIKEAKALEGMAMLSDKFDTYKDLINVSNGTIDLRTGTISEHSRTNYITMISDVVYRQEADCPTWIKFLEDITDNDDELMLYLKRMVGYCLTGLTTEQCMFILYGVGKNGKSTFTSTIAKLLGDYVKNAQPTTLMQKNNDAGGARGDILRLKGARFVTTYEPDENFRLDEPMIKQMTGDSTYTVRRLYQDEVEFTPEFKIVMSTNYKPIIKGTDEGIWRRVKLVPFSVYITEDKRDKDLLDKLEIELSGILNWALEGARGWYEHGLPRCEAVENATKEYRSDMDNFQQFIDDCLVNEDGSMLQASVLYDIYKSWSHENGNKYPMSNVKFSGKIKQRYESKRTNSGVVYIDVALSERSNLMALLR